MKIFEQLLVIVNESYLFKSPITMFVFVFSKLTIHIDQKIVNYENGTKTLTTNEG